MNDNKLNQELTRIYQRDGEVTPSVLLKDNTRKTAPLHSRFTWDNEKAAHQHRLDQARKMIRVGRVLVEDQPEQLVHVPIVSGRSEGSYKTADVIAKSVDDYALAMTEAVTKLNAAERAVRLLQAAAEGSKDDKLAKISLAIRAIETAREAIAH